MKELAFILIAALIVATLVGYFVVTMITIFAMLALSLMIAIPCYLLYDFLRRNKSSSIHRG